MTSDTFSVERIETPTGPMRIVSDDEGRLRGVDWEDCTPRLQELLRRYNGSSIQLREVSARSAAARSLLAYFAGELDAIDSLPTAAGGTPFQRAVWSALRRIPAGRTMSYGALAAKIGHPKAVRAVGHANGANPIANCGPLPSGDRSGRLAHRLWRRDRAQALAAGARKRRFALFGRTAPDLRSIKSTPAY